MKISNIKPAVLSPVYIASAKGDFDPIKYIKKIIVEKITEPLVAGTPATITSPKGVLLSEDDIANLICMCGADRINITAEETVKEILSQTMAFYKKDNDLTVNDMYTVQAAIKEKMDMPSSTVIYTPASDIKPSCAEFLAGQCSYSKLFASFSFYTRSKTLGFYFANNAAFKNFKKWLNEEIQKLKPVLSADTYNKFTDLRNNISLKDLTESLILRESDNSDNGKWSFSRVLINKLMTYTKIEAPDYYGVMPFNMAELFCPKTIVFINLEQHKNANPRRIAKEWETIRNALQAPLKILSKSQLTKLTTAQKLLNNIKMKNKNMLMTSNNDEIKATTAKIKFLKTAPTSFDMARAIKRVLKKVATTNRTENTYKETKMTFARSNRRDPDDFNKQGKITSTRYKPDIHIYLDTSGSISERHYQDAVKSLIKFAKKLNVNLYYNSFSSYLSPTTKLNLKNKSISEIYKEFNKIKQVSGGTDYVPIWQYINMSKSRQKELSLIITDFEYYCPNEYIKHPKNLFYLPVSCVDYKRLCMSAEMFCKSMKHIDSNCRKKLLF